MQRVTLTLVLVLCWASTTFAQFDADKLFGGATIGYASPSGDFQEFADGGLTFTVVAGYKLTEQLSVGIEYGSAITAAVDTTLASGIFGLENYGLNNYFLKGWYRFLDGSFSPYASIGLGLASISEPDFESNGQTIEGASKTGFGGDLELGLVIGGFNLSYTYVIGGKTPEDPVFSTRAGGVNVSYHRYQLGYLYNF